MAEKKLREVLEEMRTKGISNFKILEEVISVLKGNRGLPETETKDFDESKSKSEFLKVEISSILHEIGIPANILGYRYLRDAILLVIEEPTAIDGITKLLYPRVAKLNNTTHSRVERAIRHAIEVAWDRGNEEVLDSYFGCTIQNDRGKPTNSEFIAMITDKLKLKYSLS